MNRLRRLLEHIPKQASTIADIGGDHGLLCIEIAQSFNHNIFFTDINPEASRMAHIKFKSFQINAECFTGFGLDPFLVNGINCDNIVLSGLGLQTIYSILVNNTGATIEDSNFHSMEDFLQHQPSKFPPRKHFFNSGALDTIGVNRIVMQPAPPRMMSQHRLTGILYFNGWKLDQQNIDSIGRYFYVTSSYVRSPTSTVKPILDVGLYSQPSPELDIELFRQNPLVQKHEDGRLCEKELLAWTKYLTAQKRYFEQKLWGFSYAHNKLIESSESISWIEQDKWSTTKTLHDEICRLLGCRATLSNQN